jgi:hypothetical protein
VTPDGAGPLILDALQEWDDQLNQGALVTIDGASRRVRVLPLRADEQGNATSRRSRCRKVSSTTGDSRKLAVTAANRPDSLARNISRLRCATPFALG